MKKNKNIFIIILILFFSVSGIKAKTGNNGEKSDILKCINCEPFYLGVKKIVFKIKNISGKPVSFYFGIKAKLPGVKNAKREIYIEKINNKEYSFKTGETKKIIWKLHFKLRFKDIKDFAELSSESSKYIRPKLILFAWNKNIRDYKNHIYIKMFFLSPEIVKKPDYKKECAEELKCAVCLNKKHIFKQGEIITFRIKNVCAEEKILDICIKIKRKDEKWMPIASNLPTADGTWLSNYATFKPYEAKEYHWDPRYRWIYGKKLHAKDEIRHDLKGKTLVLYQWCHRVNQKEFLKKIFEFRIE